MGLPGPPTSICLMCCDVCAFALPLAFHSGWGGGGVQAHVLVLC